MKIPWHLIEAWQDETATEEQLRELQAWLHADRKHLKVFACAAHLELGMVEAARAAAGRSEESVSSPPEAKPPIPTSAAPFFGWRSIFAALAVCLLAGVYFWGGARPVARAEIILTASSDAVVERGGQMRAALPGDSLLPGDVLRTSVGGSAALSWQKGVSSVAVRENSVFRIHGPGSETSFYLETGEAGFVAGKQAKHLAVGAPHLRVRVLGTRFEVFAGPLAARVVVTEGQVELGRPGQAEVMVLDAGFAAIARAKGPIQVERAALGAGLAPAPPEAGIPPSPAGMLAQAPSGTGAILREYWLGVAGNSVAALATLPAYPHQPNGHDFPASLESIDGGPARDNYGARWRGYLHPPATGDYTFRISADDAAELYLSDGDQPSSKRLMARVPSFTFQHEWARHPEQTSVSIRLEAGRRYYIEVLHAEMGGGDHVAVAWQREGSNIEIIQGQFLSPFAP